MLNDKLKKLVEDPNVLYLYEVGLQIYGLFEDTDDRDFIVVVETENIDDVIQTYDLNDNFTIFHKDSWFDMVLNSKLLAWRCACLPRKFVHKETVKLLLQSNPLALRKEFNIKNKTVFLGLDELFENGNTITAQKCLFYLIEHVVLSNQIIENHKIVSFKVLKPYYQKMVNGLEDKKEDIMNTYNRLIEKDYNIFKINTDPLIKSEIVKKIIEQNEGK